MAFLRGVVRQIRWQLPLALMLGLVAAGPSASTGAATASSVTAVRPTTAEASGRPAPLVVQTDTQVACLRGKSVGGILQTQSGFGWAPVAGTPVLPLPPAAAFAAGRYSHVPLLQGTNHDEGRFFVALGYDLERRAARAVRPDGRLLDPFRRHRKPEPWPARGFRPDGALLAAILDHPARRPGTGAQRDRPGDLSAVRRRPQARLLGGHLRPCLMIRRGAGEQG